MGKTIAEKILARASRKDDVEAGDFVIAKIDLHYNLEIGLTEVHEKAVKAGLLQGLPRIADPDAIAVVLGDHEGCHAKTQDAAAYKKS